jgi:hypothetical protein
MLNGKMFLVITMKDFIILTDTRQQKESHIIKEFDKQKIMHIRTTLESADYMAIRYDEERGFYKDYSILIDTKKDLEEISSNLCNSQNHERIKREIQRAKDLGCKDFIFLIANNKIKTLDDLKQWRSKRTRVTGEILAKVMKTMKERYNVRFIIVPKKDLGKRIIELLGG